MARVSIYINDALLERARSLDSGSNTSQLVQRAIERMLSEAEERPAYASVKPSDTEARIARLREKMLAAAADDYERGYSDGLAGADHLPWWALDSFATRSNFDLHSWCEDWSSTWNEELAWPALHKEDFPDEMKVPDWVVKLADYLGGLLNPIAEWRRERPYLRGFADAWRDLWNSVERGGVDATGGAKGKGGGGGVSEDE